MSVGGGFKKGKAEFAVKDVNGKPITMATDSFKNIKDDTGTYKLIDVDGIDIGDNTYGICFNSPSQNSEANIFVNEGALIIDGSSTNTSTVKIEGDLSIAGEVYANNIYSQYVHCWTLSGTNYTFKLYIADYTGNTPSENLYTYFANETSTTALNTKYDKVFNIRGFVSVDGNEYKPQSYTIERSGTAGNYIITIKFRIIGDGPNNAVVLKRFNAKIDSNSYQNGSIVYQF